MELNHRPHAYQACALTKLSYRPIEIRKLRIRISEYIQILDALLSIPISEFNPAYHSCSEIMRESEFDLSKLNSGSKESGTNFYLSIDSIYKILLP